MRPHESGPDDPHSDTFHDVSPCNPIADHASGVTAQYSEPALIGLYETLRSAEADQHAVVANWSACVGGPGSCTGSVSLYADF
jgi:hypothetical protein